MTVPTIEAEDLGQLADLCPDLQFEDDERRNVLLVAGSKDVQAAPGSGKTTLLAAKLLLMSQKWPHRNRGVCVLSHTNVARDEIAKILGTTTVGSRLLGYPHFVGTIHAFVNQFLALPLLRSNGVAVDVIDNDVFAAQAFARLKYKYTLKKWVEMNPYKGPGAIATLRYEGAELALGWEEGSLPGSGSESHTQAMALKNELTERGIFRHEDMFAFAASLIATNPDLPSRVSQRFPFVLIDEMQDTSWAQEELLSTVFDHSVVVQRFGDRNQRILSSKKDADKLTFPRADCLHVTSTKRFPEHIAAAVRAVQEQGEPVTAAAGGGGYPPLLLLYDTDAVTKVIDHFGSAVLSTIPDHVLRTGSVKAVCTRKQGDGKQDPGRHLGDYWPTYLPDATTSSGEEGVYRLLADHPQMGVTAVNLGARVQDVQRALLLSLRAAGCESVKGIRDASGLMRSLDAAGANVIPLRALCRQLTLGRGLTASEVAWNVTLDLLHDGLASLLPAGVSRVKFGELSVFERPLTAAAAMQASKECIVSLDGRSVRIQIGTVASVKGETHVATLVLESYGGQSKKFDLETAQRNISGAVPMDKKASDLLRGQYRNLYVAMSRPRHFLCLAMNKARADQASVAAMVANGWVVAGVPK